MVLGLSYGELFFTLGVISIILGPKDLPIIARNLGRFTGSAAAYVSRARAKLSTFADEAEVSQLHRELRDSLHQLQAIRAELRSGISLTNPGPLTSRLLKLPPEATLHGKR
ncbi:hypothetical protein WJX81_004596 [Elliptochloris bilobata]|uniref:Uncharacterized protein n=1 Tax=Elliptochloris bilobata TaxID=381761 RepID=A0AAW1S0S2_9CHLO